MDNEIEFIKIDSDWDCRAIPDKLLNRFLKDSKAPSLYPFLELVQKHKELEIGLRGNDHNGKPTNGGTVIIYRNNHAMFTVKYKSVTFNPNCLRYYPEWQTAIEELVSKYGFNKGSIPRLGPVVKSENRRTNAVSFSCSFENSSISAPISEKLSSELEDLYTLFTRIFDAFFSDDGTYKLDRFLSWGNENDLEYKGKVIFKEKKKELEKIRQQQLFSLMKKQKDGYLFYDMEFKQKHKSSNDAKIDRLKGLDNKPDMQAIRFDSDGKPQAWVFVEVKSTGSAYDGRSSLMDHLEKMRKYIMDEENLKRRRREAYMMLYQYNKLGLLNLERDIDIAEYEDIPAEIIIILTDEAIDKWVNDTDKDILALKDKQDNALGVEITLGDGSRAILVKDMKIS